MIVPRPPFRLSCEKRLLAKNVTRRMKKRYFLLFDFFIGKAFILFNKKKNVMLGRGVRGFSARGDSRGRVARRFSCV